MKLLNRAIERDNTGTVTLLPEETEDMWHAYNLISVGDRVRATTIRRVQTESNTGSVDSSRVRTTLTVQVENIEFDTAACALRVKGKNVEENQFVKLGAFHTIDLELNRKFSIAKDEWDIIAVERLETACDPRQSADLAAVVMQEGLANVCLVTASMTIVRARIEVNIPRKRRGHAQQHEKGLERFFEAVMQAIVRHVNFEIVKCCVIASPGFVKDQFLTYMFAQALKADVRAVLENKSKFVAVHSTSGHKHSLKELLSDETVLARLQDTKAAGEVRTLETFYNMLSNEPDRAYYGYDHVMRAAERLGVETLLISDELFRSQDVKTRKKYVALVEAVKNSNGDVKIFSSLHVSGEQLGQLSGVAAILRFPMPDIEDEEGDAHNA